LSKQDGADHLSDLGSRSSKIPKIGTATDWHDGQFAHDTHAQFPLGLSGKSVIAHLTTDAAPLALRGAAMHQAKKFPRWQPKL
jgi:hypothetical protein